VDVTEFLLYLYAESPVHAGAADSLDVLDLPVQREAATGYPVIWGQSLKGALRQAARESDAWDDGLVTRAFGTEPGVRAAESGTEAGLLAVGDAQLVAMPVPTLRRTFAWMTSEIALGRLARKYLALRREVLPVPEVAQDRGAAPHKDWTDAPDEVLGPCVVPLGDEQDPDLARWAELLARDAIGEEEPFTLFAGKLRTDLLLVGSSVVPDLLRECTEQAVRVQLDAAKTVQNGPFYSEYLPAETLLAASLTLRRSTGSDATAEDRGNLAEPLRGLLHDQLLQIGGDETLGKGLMWGRLLESQPA
jgi:CRISPR-associated protein Cmr4